MSDDQLTPEQLDDIRHGAGPGDSGPPATPDTSEWTEAQHRATWAVLDILKRRGTTVTVQAAIAVVDAVTRELAGDQAAAAVRRVRELLEAERDGCLGEPPLWIGNVEAALEPDACRIREDLLFEHGQQVDWCVRHDLPAAHAAVERSPRCQRCGVGIAPGVNVEAVGPHGLTGIRHSDPTVCRHYGRPPQDDPDAGVTADTPAG